VSTLDDIYRLAATYFGRHREWPRELRLDAQRLHALAHEVGATDFERICVNVRLRARRTPGASVGGRSVVQLGEAEGPPLDARELAVLWLGVQPREIMSFANVFFPRPSSWGLRGDPHLWDALSRRFAGSPVPTDQSETVAVLYYAIREIIGCDIRDADEMVRVPAFVTGSGMSDGHVSAEFWLQRGVPLLVR
jgi:molybdenum cofactor cytidylyltransferase